MNEKMSLRNKVILVNACIVGALAWSYYKSYPLLAIVISGVCLLTLANALMHIKHRK